LACPGSQRNSIAANIENVVKYRITILCDNTVGALSGTLGEHGFAALVEWDGGSLLFDTGHGETLLHNAERMNRDLCQINRVVLSHGHYDHSGGLLPLLRASGGKEILAHPAIFLPRYRVKDTGESIPIGIPHPEELLRELGGMFNLCESFREIADGVFLTGEVPRKNGFELGDTGLFRDPAGNIPDEAKDDQSLVIISDKGLVLLLGCCHAGLINTIDHARERTGIDKVYAMIGGTHLGFCDQSRLDETVRALRKYRIEKICPGHCTGFAASARLMKEFPRQFQPAQVGFTIEV
jgi:7,8-dihydropterin-6-yl-methyl-4-(beta-D-ribofuranosyl)aminobenzene 5'-phosphate synthase